MARLKSLNNLLNAIGYQEYMYEAFVDETLMLLEQTGASIPCQDEGAALLASFNDDAITGAIITHFRVSMISRSLRTANATIEPNKTFSS